MQVKIAILLSSLCAEGTPVLALEMARAWQRKGINFKVCTFQGTPADLAPEFAAAGIEVENLAMTFQGYRKFPDLVWRVFSYCRRNDIDAVLSFPFGWHSYVSWGARLAGAQRVVAHAGNYPPTNSPGAIRRLRITLAIGGVWHTNIACCSNHVRDGLKRHLHVPESLLHTIYNGIDLHQFQDKPQRRTINEPIRVGMVARFEPHKDQPTLMRTASLLRSRGIQILIDLVGDGSRRAEYEELSKQLGIESQVRFLGVRRDIPNLLREWDVFVFSVNPDEGLGIALIEALSSGIPVIASDVGACREVLSCATHGMLGDLFPCGDAEQLAESITRFRDDPDPWWERAKRARTSAQTRFSIESMADAYLHLLGAN
jgi:glycosyltransferase involved in cell wall biosynthesis